MSLDRTRTIAAAAAVVAHCVAKNPRRNLGADSAKPGKNPDFADDVADLIADVLLMAHAKGADVIAITSAALSHVPPMGAAYAALAPVANANAEARANAS